MKEGKKGRRKESEVGGEREMEGGREGERERERERIDHLQSFNIVTTCNSCDSLTSLIIC